MDLRYLEFLLASYSWAVIVFAAIMVLWLVLNNITEIAVAGIKVKPRIAFRSLGSLIVLMALFSICTSYLVEQIPPEIELQDGLRDAANLDQNQAKERWRAFFEKITHETDTMAFAFIRIEQRPDPQTLKSRSTVTESSVQYALKTALYGLPIAFLFLEVGLLGYLFPFRDAETQLAWLLVFVIGVIWFVSVRHGIDQITAIITDLASRAS
jgi:hypothetical protein